MASIPAAAQYHPPRTRIILVDDHPLMRQALRMWIEREQDLEVVAEASDGAEAVAIASKLHPDIVIMDITLPRLSGLEATRQIVASCPHTAVLVVTVHTDVEHLLGLQRAGASGYLSKSASGEEIVHAIRTVAAGEVVFPPADSQGTPPKGSHSSPARLNELTTRELTILKLLAEGMPNKLIAAELNMSLRRVKATTSTVFLKLGVSSRTEAIAVGLKSGIITLSDL